MDKLGRPMVLFVWILEKYLKYPTDTIFDMKLHTYTHTSGLIDILKIYFIEHLGPNSLHLNL